MLVLLALIPAVVGMAVFARQEDIVSFDVPMLILCSVVIECYQFCSAVSASVNLPLHHKVQKFYSGTGSLGWSRKKGRKTVVVWCVVSMVCGVKLMEQEAA